MQAFEHISDATYTGVLKPDPQAYLGCLQALGLPPEDAVFVDDQARNVDGARRLGIPTVAFDVTRPEASCAMARQLLQIER
jgi:putative hydrolase of the HAD superfamily